MQTYIVNLNEAEDGKHTVHVRDCEHAPNEEHQGQLGLHRNCKTAIKEAGRVRDNWEYDGCAFCCPDCHKS